MKFQKLLLSFLLTSGLILATVSATAQDDELVDIDSLVRAMDSIGVRVEDAGEREDEYEQKTYATDESIRFNRLNSVASESAIVPNNGTLSSQDKQKISDDPAFWYANFEKEKKVKRQEQSISSSPKMMDGAVAQTILWILGIGIFITIILLYINQQMAPRGRRVSAKQEEEDMELPDDIFSIDYPVQIDRARKAANWPLLVRLLYLQSLTRLISSNIVQYKQDKTNFDYLVQLRQHSLYQDFFKVTRHYEYVWYGKFPVNEAAIQQIEKDFQTLQSRLY